MSSGWKVAGWLLVAIAAVLAVIAAIMALDAVSQPDVIVPYIPGPGQPGPSRLVLAPVELLRAVIIAVLSGVAFFGGLTCFLLGVLNALRRQLPPEPKPATTG